MLDIRSRKRQVIIMDSEAKTQESNSEAKYWWSCCYMEARMGRTQGMYNRLVQIKSMNVCV